jgi:hypothetical protein
MTRGPCVSYDAYGPLKIPLDERRDGIEIFVKAERPSPQNQIPYIHRRRVVLDVNDSVMHAVLPYTIVKRKAVTLQSNPGLVNLHRATRLL